MNKVCTLAAPFPWFGGKMRVAPIVWRALGNPAGYIEPFFGSGACLFARPEPRPNEIVNDYDALVCNAWRAIQNDPDEVARWADQPVFENDLHARNIWVVGQLADLQSRIEGDPDYYDARIAGYWVWGMSISIGMTFGRPGGPWTSVCGKMVKKTPSQCGIIRRRPHLTSSRSGVTKYSMGGQIQSWMHALCERLRHVRVCCGDWTRVLTKPILEATGTTGIFLDPPYDHGIRDKTLYRVDDESIAQNVRNWAIEHGDNPKLRIALCGLEGEHEMPNAWQEHIWESHGMERQTPDKKLEKIWFSPHCLAINDRQMGMFE